MTRPEVSVQLYTVRDPLSTSRDATLERLANMGLKSVEPFGLPTEMEELKNSLRRIGLTAPTAHAGLLNDPSAAIAAAQQIGCELVIEPWQPDSRFESKSEVSKLADDLIAASKLAEASGLKIGYHNHAHELTNQIGGIPALYVLADLTPSDVLFEVDLYWCQAAGEDPLAVLARLSGRVAALHAKDAPKWGAIADQVPLGHGDVPLLEAFAAVPNARVIVEFDEYAGDIFEGIEKSLEYLESNGIW